MQIKKRSFKNTGMKLIIIHEQFLLDAENMLHEWNNFLKEKKMLGEHSVLTMRILQYISVDLHVIALNFISGLYPQVFRELRFLLESWTQAYYLNKINPKARMEEKLNYNKLLSGKELFYSTFSEKTRKARKFHLLFKDLSQFIHPTYEELRRFDHVEKIKKFAETSVYYREEDYNRCLNHWKKVHFIILNLIR